MNTCSHNAEVRTLSEVEIDLIYGGTNPTPTQTNLGDIGPGGANVSEFSCPSGWGIVGNQGGLYVSPVEGNIYGGFQCGNSNVPSVDAYQSGGGWDDWFNVGW